MRAHILLLLSVLTISFVASSCGGSQSIRYYQTEVMTDEIDEARTTSSDVVIGVEDFSTASAYDEQRIVYRTGRFNFNYYHYHRWASPPGMLVADLLRRVYQRTGAFRAVVDGFATSADVILSGRVAGFEEVDVSGDEWVARVDIELQLRDATTGELLWSDRFQRDHPVDDHTPTGLTAGLSSGVTHIGVETTDKIIEIAKKAKKSRPRNPSRPSFMKDADSPDDAPGKRQPDGPSNDEDSDTQDTGETPE